MVVPGLLLAAVLGTTTPSHCEAPASALPEASGAVVSDRQPDVVFSHDDSGDSARVVALSFGCRVLGTWSLPLPMPTDWEDAALGPDHTLVLGDIGDNLSRRSSVQLVTIPEPVVGQPLSGKPVVRVLRYTDGPHDAEGLVVQPVTGQVWVVTKSWTGVGGVYAARGSSLVRVATVRLGALEPVTGASVRRDGRAVVLRTYDRAVEWEVPAGQTDLGAVLGGKAPHVLDLPGSPQGEGVSYTADGTGLVLTSEAQGEKTWPIDVVALPWRNPAPSPAPSGSATGPSTVLVRESGSPWWLALPIAGGVLLLGLGGTAIALARRRRVRA